MTCEGRNVKLTVALVVMAACGSQYGLFMAFNAAKILSGLYL